MEEGEIQLGLDRLLRWTDMEEGWARAIKENEMKALPSIQPQLDCSASKAFHCFRQEQDGRGQTWGERSNNQQTSTYRPKVLGHT